MRILPAILLMVLALSIAVPAQRRMSDAENDRFKGKVHSVTREYADFDSGKGEQQTPTRRLSAIYTYNPEGRQLTSKNYDYRGNLFQDTVYSLVEGFRTMKSQFSHHDYDPPPAAAPPGQAASKTDSRYDIKYVDSYDNTGRRSEVLLVGSDGKIRSLLSEYTK